MRVREGDLDSMGPLFERYKKPLFGFFSMASIGNKSRGEDTLYNAFCPKTNAKRKFSVFSILK